MMALTAPKQLLSLLPIEARSQVVHLRHRKGYESLRKSPPAYDPIGAFDNLKCIFVHIPKTGGKSVKEAIFGSKTKGGHRSAYDLMCIFGPRTFYRYFSFAFVRNPYDRIASAYTFLINGGINDKDRAFAERHLLGYNSFHDFIMDWLNPDTAYVYHHFKPQHHYIFTSNGRCLVNTIGRFESLERDFGIIRDRLGISAELPHRNRTPGAADIDRSYRPESRAKVASIYSLDFELLGYDR